MLIRSLPTLFFSALLLTACASNDSLEPGDVLGFDAGPKLDGGGLPPVSEDDAGSSEPEDDAGMPDEEGPCRADQVVCADACCRWEPASMPLDALGIEGFHLASIEGRPALVTCGDGFVNVVRPDTDGWDRRPVLAEDAEGVNVACRLAEDADGNLHVTYAELGGALHYGSQDGDDWSFETVVDGAAEGDAFLHSLDLNAEGQPRVATHDPRNDQLVYFQPTDEGWLPAVLDPESTAGRAPTLALDSEGFPHILSAGRSGQVRQAWWTGEAWAYEDVARGGNARLFLDPDDGLHAILAGEAGLVYAQRGGDEWEGETLPDTGGARGADVVIDDTGVVHVVFLGDGEYLQYARRETDGTWNRGEIPAGAAKAGQLAIVEGEMVLALRRDGDLVLSVLR